MPTQKQRAFLASTAGFIRRIGLTASLSACLLLGGSALAAPVEKPRGPVRRLSFRLELDRMFPSQVTVEEGTYVVRVQNPLVLKALDVSIRSGGNKAAGKLVSKRASKADIQMELHPGKYTVEIAEFPQWTAEVIVTPAK